MVPFVRPRRGDLAGIRGQAGHRGSSRRKPAHNAAVSERGAGPAEGVLSSIRPVPLLTGLEPAVLVQQ